MGTLVLISKFLPLLFVLLKVAEDEFKDKPKSGAEKKESVMTFIHEIISGMVSASTGGQGETWKFLDRVISPLIDLFAWFLFPNHSE